MKLDQFDKLQNLLTELEDKVLQLKQSNYRLDRENKSLKSNLSALESLGNINFQKENLQLKQENEKLNAINGESLKRINHLIKMMSSQNVLGNGVGIE